MQNSTPPAPLPDTPGRAQARALLWTLLQCAVVAAALAICCWPTLRGTLLRPATLVLVGVLLFAGVVHDHRRGVLRMTPGQIYQGFRSGRLQTAAPLDTLASMLGLIAWVVLL